MWAYRQEPWENITQACGLHESRSHSYLFHIYTHHTQALMRCLRMLTERPEEGRENDM